MTNGTIVQRAARFRGQVQAEQPGSVAVLDQLERAMVDDLKDRGVPITEETVLGMLAGCAAIVDRAPAHGADVRATAEVASEVAAVTVGLHLRSVPAGHWWCRWTSWALAIPAAVGVGVLIPVALPL